MENEMFDANELGRAYYQQCRTIGRFCELPESKNSLTIDSLKELKNKVSTELHKILYAHPDVTCIDTKMMDAVLLVHLLAYLNNCDLNKFIKISPQD